MSDSTETTTSSKDARPAYIAYWVRDREGKKASWTRCGAAWVHADGKGLNIALDLHPIDGRISIRLASEKKT